MERKLASIQKIISLTPIAGADKIEKATVLGWEVVVKKGDFNVGDYCVYCEIDSILPDKPCFEFMRDRKFRVRTIKLKGQISQGICFPLSILPKGKIQEGDDVTKVLGVIKYDPQAEIERKETERLANIKKHRLSKFFMRYPWYRRFVFKPQRLPFPAWIKKTDEDRIQLFPDICQREQHTIFQVTEKLDGQSATYFVIKNPSWTRVFKPYIFGVCSRNFQLLKPDGQSYWELAKRLKIEQRLTHIAKYSCHDSIVLQGEVIGAKIQGNKYNRTQNEFYVFNLIVSGFVFQNANMKVWCDSFGFTTVPHLAYSHRILPDINMMVNHATGNSELADVPREGLVWRNYDKNISFKVINPEFLLKHGE